MRIVYSEHYDIGFMGLEKLHPFDSRKYSRVWRRLSERFGSDLADRAIHPRAAIGREDLLRVHEASYFDQLRRSSYVAKALEVLPLALLPAWLLDRQVLLPMRWATQGTVLAARECLSHGLAVGITMPSRPPAKASVSTPT